MKKIFLSLAVFIAAGQLFAQGTKLLREPGMSAEHIVFVYANDLWVNERGSNDAIRLTSAIGAERDPHLSPDGQWVAFSAQYDGNTDVYLVSINGGEPRRLTWHPGADQVVGWTPDGGDILFASGRMAQPSKRSRIYKISMEGGMPVALPPHRAAYGDISDDGKTLAYMPFNEWDSEWRNYRGGQAQPIWILNLEDLSLKQTPRTDGERHIKPVWFKDRIYFISERDYAANIWSYDPENGDLKQHTFLGKYDIKNLAAGPDKLIFEQGGNLHLLNPDDNNIESLEITVKGDFNWARTRWENISARDFSAFEISPSGKRGLFEYRGDIFTVPKEEGDWRNLSSSPGVADRAPVWSPKGDKIAWFSDKSGEYKLMIGKQDGLEEPEEIALPNPTFYFKPA